MNDLARAGARGRAEQGSVLVIYKGVASREDIEGRERVELRGRCPQMGAVTRDLSRGEGRETMRRPIETAMHDGQPQGDVLTSQTLRQCAETVSVTAMIAVDGTVETEGKLIDALEAAIDAV